MEDRFHGVFEGLSPLRFCLTYGTGREDPPVHLANLALVIKPPLGEATEDLVLEQKILAVLWPDERNYERFRAICSVDELHNSLASYRAAANVRLRQLEREGMEIERVSFDTEELLIFANERGAPVDGRMRAEYAAFLVASRNN